MCSLECMAKITQVLLKSAQIKEEEIEPNLRELRMECENKNAARRNK